MALRFIKKSFWPIFVPAFFCASVGAASNATRHVLSPSKVSRLSRIAVTTLFMTLLFTIKEDMRFPFQERDCPWRLDSRQLLSARVRLGSGCQFQQFACGAFDFEPLVRVLHGTG